MLLLNLNEPDNNFKTAIDDRTPRINHILLQFEILLSD